MIMPLGIEFQLPQQHFMDFDFHVMAICPLAQSISFHLHCNHMEFSSHHIIASPLARNWAPMMLQYAIPYVVVRLSSCHQCVILCVCQVVKFSSMCGLMCLSGCHHQCVVRGGRIVDHSMILQVWVFDHITISRSTSLPLDHMDEVLT